MRRGFWRGYGIGATTGAFAGLLLETYGANRTGFEWVWLGYFIVAALFTWGIWDQ